MLSYVLDTAALAFFIIYSENNGEAFEKPSERNQFHKGLGGDLCCPLILTRSKILHIIGRFSIRSAIECILDKSFEKQKGKELCFTSQVNHLPNVELEANIVPQRDAIGHIKITVIHMLFVLLFQTKKIYKIKYVKCKKPICAEHNNKLHVKNATMVHQHKKV